MNFTLVAKENEICFMITGNNIVMLRRRNAHRLLRDIQLYL